MRTFVMLSLLLIGSAACGDSKTTPAAAATKAKDEKEAAAKKVATEMPREIAQQLRADQAEASLILQQAQQRINFLYQRSDKVLADYDTTLDKVDLETGKINRVPPAAPAKTNKK